MTSTAPDTTAGVPPRSQAQRRVLAVLVSGQILSGAGLAAGITVGALLAQDMLGSTDLAGCPAPCSPPARPSPPSPSAASPRPGAAGRAWPRDT